MPNDNTRAIAESYEAVPYDAKPNPVSHPDHLAAIATMFGLEVRDVGHARVLEVGCSDGANLLPIAVTLPNAHCVGCDLSPTSIQRAREATAALGLRNVEWFACDLRALPAMREPFDFVIVHGVYSWVPAPVRDALFGLAVRSLAPKGVLFVSYNVYPGGHTKRAVSEMLLAHIANVPDPHDRLAAARQLAALLAGVVTTRAADAGIQIELRQIAEATDSELAHDVLAVPNDYFYFHEFAAHAARHGLAYLAEAAPAMMGGTGLDANMRAYLARLEYLVREQYIDYARLRRFRQSILCRADAPCDFRLVPSRATALHATASKALVQAALDGHLPGVAQGPRPTAHQRIFERLVAAAPSSVPLADLAASIGAPPGANASVDAALVEIWLSGFMQLRTKPLQATATAGARPHAFPLARWQVGTRESVTNLMHETVRLADPFAHALLALLDGTLDRTEIVRRLATDSAPAESASIAARVDETLRSLAQFGLLMR